jgi:hypothetical protein
MKTDTMKVLISGRFNHSITRALALGTALCGAAIVYTGWNLHFQASGPFKKNLDALAATIKELDRTIIDLRRDFGSFNGYLGTLRDNLKITKSNTCALEMESGKFIVLIGTSTPKLLADTARLIQEASKISRTTADQAGQIPTDPLNSQRKSMYNIAGTLTDSAGTLETVSSDIAAQAIKVEEITKSSFETAESVLEASSGQIEILTDGSLKHVPVVMESMAEQLNAHLQLIESSYNLVQRVTIPIIAVGLGFFFIGLRGMLLPGPERQMIAQAHVAS